MKILLTIILSFVVIVSSVVVLSGTACALDKGASLADRGSFALVALIALGFDIVSIFLIGKINRRQE